MTRSIREVLALVPGQTPPALDDANLGRYLRDHYDTESEKARNRRHAIRDEFYRDGACKVMEDVVDDFYEDATVRSLRKKQVKHARFSNVVKRIVGELSTVYIEPAARSVGGDDANEERYRAICESLMLDEQMKEVNRLANLHRVVLVGPRVRVDEDGVPTMALDIATPAVVRAVVHPLDTTLVVAWLIKCDDRVRKDYTSLRRPAWQLWTAHELINLDERMMPIGDDVVHAIGVNRWVPVSLIAIGVAGYWPGEDGEDLVAAAVSICMANVNLLKETTTATKQTFLHGDVSTTAKGQSMDTALPAVVGEGVSATTVDMSMDTSIFTRTSNHVLESAGNGRGLSMAQLTHQGTQSAEARELIMEPLKILRREQISYFRRFEKRLAIVMAAVAKRYAPAELGFTVEKWRQDFGEIQSITPLKQRIEEHVALRQIGADDILSFLRRENPDLDSDEAAFTALVEHLDNETKRIALMRTMMAMSGGTVDGKTPAANPTDANGNTQHGSAMAPPMQPQPYGAADDADDLSWVEGMLDAA